MLVRSAFAISCSLLLLLLLLLLPAVQEGGTAC
jgi:hypothetical protein